ncbi:hypothetical protein PUH89_10525 [Rhodobacter capsulatus]|uniref:Uncharacterized protein n=1 Tax=Rhodobacter capsulatus TaxID=1061 RepID=A0A1G7JA52_RHOCA|nr:hypothetical protein [Rhodobacter capsulatus]WER07780.1 hypothetical protein PUH89_10525 [Rhodobacter capsulatus]SDF21781.1 hypothetical protein SAMN04244550_01868 [Rhodobacter capsulatus]
MKKICLACLLCALPFAAQAQQVPGAARVSTKAPAAQPATVKTPAAKTPTAKPGAPGGAAADAKEAGVEPEATGFLPLLGGLGALGGVAAAGVVAAAVAGGGGGATTDTQ